MGYPTSRPRIPSASRSRALVRGMYGSLAGRGTWTGLRTGVRHWRPGRGNFFGALIAYAIISSITEPTDDELQTTRPMPDLSGWSVICGPFDHPGFPYGTTVLWRADSPLPVACDAPLGGQAGYGQAAIPATARQLRFAYQNDQLLPLVRGYTYWHLGRTDAPATALRVRAEDRPIPVAVPLNPVVTAPPLTPTRPLPFPVWATPSLPAATWPQQGDRGYAPPAVPLPQAEPVPGVRVITRGLGYVDIRSPPWEREAKVAPQVGNFFRLMSTYGSVNSIINAMFYALPPSVRAGRGGTQHQRNMAVLQNLDQVNFSQFAWSSATWWLNYKAAGMFFGGLVNNLSDDFGVRGFDLYRAWATGDYYYRGVTHAGNPRRLNPSSMQGQPLADASVTFYSPDGIRRKRAIRSALNHFQASGGTREDRQVLHNRLRRIRRRYARRNGE